jgi:hypothetical protein
MYTSFLKNSASTCRSAACSWSIGSALMIHGMTWWRSCSTGGALPHSSPVRLMDGELSGFGWYIPQMAARLLPARTWRRAEAALTAAAKGTAVYLTDGYPARLSGSFSLPVTSR